MGEIKYKTIYIYVYNKLTIHSLLKVKEVTFLIKISLTTFDWQSNEESPFLLLMNEYIIIEYIK